MEKEILEILKSILALSKFYPSGGNGSDFRG